MKSMKKWIALLLCVFMLGTLIACDTTTPPANQEQNDQNNQNQDNLNQDNQNGNTNNNQNETDNNTQGGESDENTTPAEFKLNVCTYNVWRCADYAASKKGTMTEKANPDNIVKFIKDKKLDIVAMQEVDVNNSRSSTKKSEYKDQPKYIAEKLMAQTGETYYYAFGAALIGYHSKADTTYENEYGYDKGLALYGNAIISKYPILSTRTVEMVSHSNYDAATPSTQVNGDMERRVLLIAEIEVDGQTITVISTHLGLTDGERENALRKVREEMQKITTPVILMGDMNDTYGSTVISGFSELLTPVQDGTGPYTYDSYNPKTKIDWIFISDEFLCEHSRTWGVQYSDHLPMVATLKWNSTKS